MAIIGQFRDLDRANRFVWMRGFPDMASRLASLTAFYSGDRWKAQSAEANATMLDVSDVLLLHPVGTIDTAGITSDSRNPGILVATVVHLNDAGIEAFSTAFARSILPILTEHDGDVVATYETDTRPNDFPRLPVREGERVFVWLSRFASTGAYEEHRNAIVASPEWLNTVVPLLDRLTASEPYIHLLQATPGSRYQP